MRIVGVDTGGTFTDLVYIDEAECVHSMKIFSTRDDPSRAISNGLERLGVDVDAVELFIHGTTVATNAVLERAGARVGMLTTAGHLDRLDLQRTNLTKLYDLSFRRPRPLVERRLRREVVERIRADGGVHRPLDEEGTRAAARVLADEGAEVLVICFLNSYASDAHEQRAKELVAESVPHLPVLTSSESLAEALEYERFSTAVISAYLTPVMDRYLANLERYLHKRGFTGQFRVMQGNGGLMGSDTARAQAAVTLESGPAAGVTGAIDVAAGLGRRDLITLDIGGTSTDVCLVRDGVATTTSSYLIDGLPMRQPLLDIVSVGAGGGSIAWLDEGGGLHVGPVSAGATPGPACYGRGGDCATVTDAHVVLGRLSPRFPLGGILTVDADAAKAAIAQIASSLDMSTVETAEGILRIAEANMVDAIRLVSVERGIDARDFVLVAYGGAGPLNAGRVAAALGIREVIVPPRPGLHSAFGLTTAELRHDFVQTVLIRTAELEWTALEDAAARLEEQGRALLRTEGVPAGQLAASRSFDMRYVGQAYAPVSVPAGLELASATDPLAKLVERFHALHEQMYMHSAPGEETEVVSVRVAVRGSRGERGTVAATPREGGPRCETLSVCFDAVDGFVDCEAWEREALPPDFTKAGPCIVTQMDSTTVVYRGQQFRVAEDGSIVISVL